MKDPKAPPRFRHEAARRCVRRLAAFAACAALLACSGETPSPTAPPPACAATQLRCGGACVDVWGDPGRCGGCDVACPAGTPCVAGRCARPPRRVALGARHGCALRADGGAVCWGFFDERLGAGATDCEVDSFGIRSCETRGPAAVAGLSDAVEVASREDFTCARRADGRVLCWGANLSGQLGSAGAPGAMVAAPARVSGLVDATQVVAGRAHACALHADGTVSCWGAGERGQIGDGARVSRPTPVAVGGLRGVVEISAGRDHTCARRGDGTVACWGANGARQVATFAVADQPAPVDTYDRAVEVATGEDFTCVRHLDGSIQCSLGVALLRLADLAGVRDLTARDAGHALCGLRGGAVVCLGVDPAVRFAHTREEPLRAVAIPGVDGAVEVALGPSAGCARRRDGAVWCWGDGAVFDGVARGRVLPAAVPGLGDVEEALAGALSTCARRRGGGFACWGELRGLLEANGDGEYGHVTALAGVPTAARFAARAMDRYCALSDGEAWCWGTELNVDGDLGSSHEPATPHRVAALGPATALGIAAGRVECASRPEGSLWCRGALPVGGDAGAAREVAGVRDVTAVAMSEYGLGGVALRRDGAVVRLGLNGVIGVAEGYARVTAVTAGDSFDCGLRDDGKVLCSGDNGRGQLGDEATAARAAAALVPGLPPATSVSAGGAFACAVTRDGAVWCWGDNGQGQAAPGVVARSTAPAAVAGVAGAVGVSAGATHACAWRADGALLCWGSNASGSAGVIVPTSGAPWRLAGVP